LLNEIARERQVFLLTCREENLRHYETYMDTMQRIII
jgi:hypothetical protein